LAIIYKTDSKDKFDFTVSVGNRVTCLELLDVNKLDSLYQKFIEDLSRKASSPETSIFLFDAKRRFILQLICKIETITQVGFPKIDGSREYSYLNEKEIILRDKILKIKNNLKIKIEAAKNEKELLTAILEQKCDIAKFFKIFLKTIEEGSLFHLILIFYFSLFSYLVLFYIFWFLFIFILFFHLGTNFEEWMSYTSLEHKTENSGFILGRSLLC
jgi:hypothetical protein